MEPIDTPPPAPATPPTAEATARPWHFQDKDGPRKVLLSRRHWEIGSVSTLKGIALVFGSDEANAALIVTAVNNYDALLACRQELAYLVRLLEPMEVDGRLNAPRLAALNLARAALAEAEDTL